MNRRIKIALAISVVLNVLLAGMLLGDVSHSYIAPAVTAFNLETQLAQLPQDKRALFDTIMKPAKQKMDDERAQIDSAKKEAIRILKTEPFNKEAYLTQTQHINDMHVEMKHHLAESVAELAQHLSLAERTALAEIVSHPPFTLPPSALKETTPAGTEK